jgi:hypothetical protein
MRYRFIAAQKAEYPVTLMSRILNVFRSGFYARTTRTESARARSDRAFVVNIKAPIKLRVASMGALGCIVS